jgi:hypothetical protein
MALKICQIGGYKGSTAGDCAYIEYDESATQKKYILIDLGRDKMLPKVPREWRQAGAIERVILTHMHADHIGGVTGSTAPQANQLAKKEGRFILPSVTNSSAKATPAFNGLVGADRLHDAHTTNSIDIGTFPNLTCTIDVIRSGNTDKSAEENSNSLGVLITVTDTSNRNTWRMLSLGDMTPKHGQQSVETLLHTRLGNHYQLDAIKLAHHGSENNIMHEIRHWISDNTDVVISGHSGSSLTVKKNSLEGYLLQNPPYSAPKSISFLMQGSNDSTFAQGLSEVGEYSVESFIKKCSNAKCEFKCYSQISWHFDNSDFGKRVVGESIALLAEKKGSSRRSRNSIKAIPGLKEMAEQRNNATKAKNKARDAKRIDQIRKATKKRIQAQGTTT